MRNVSRCACAAAVFSCLCFAGQKTSAGDDIKTAGSCLKQVFVKTGVATGKATRDGTFATGKAIKNGSKKLVNKSAGAVASGAEKLEDKTR